MPLDLSLPSRQAAAAYPPETDLPRLKVRCDLVSREPRSRSPSRSPYLVLGSEEEYVRFRSSSENFARTGEKSVKPNRRQRRTEASSDSFRNKRKLADESMAFRNCESPGPVVNTGIWNLTVHDIEVMLAPFITSEDKKYNCTVCNIKFNTKPKAIRYY